MSYSTTVYTYARHYLSLFELLSGMSQVGVKNVVRRPLAFLTDRVLFLRTSGPLLES